MTIVKVTIGIETSKPAATVRDNVVALLNKAGAKVTSSYVEAPPADLTDNSPFPFGKHKGTAMKLVDPTYYEWLWNQLDEGDGWLQTKWPAVVKWLSAWRQRAQTGAPQGVPEDEPFDGIPDDDIPF